MRTNKLLLFCTVELTAVKLNTTGVNMGTKLQCHMAVTLAPLSGLSVHVLYNNSWGCHIFMGFFLCQTWEVAEGLSGTFIYSCFTQCDLRIHTGLVLYFVCFTALSVTFICSCFTQCGPRIHGSRLAQCCTLSATLHCQWHSSTPVLHNVVQGSMDPHWPSAVLYLLHCIVSDIHLLQFYTM